MTAEWSDETPGSSVQMRRCAHGCLTSRMAKEAGPEIDPAAWPEIAQFGAESAFKLPSKSVAQWKAVGVSGAMLVMSVVLIILGSILVKIVFVFGALLTGWLMVTNLSERQKAAAVYLTPTRVELHDGGGTLSVKWADVLATSIGPAVGGTRILAFVITADKGAIAATGAAKFWQVFDRHSVRIQPGRRLGGEVLNSALLTWAAAPENQRLLGTPAGRHSFWLTHQH